MNVLSMFYPVNELFLRSEIILYTFRLYYSVLFNFEFVKSYALLVFSRQYLNLQFVS